VSLSELHCVGGGMARTSVRVWTRDGRPECYTMTLLILKSENIILVTVESHSSVLRVCVKYSKELLYAVSTQKSTRGASAPLIVNASLLLLRR
jgi:hypothetical protein